LLLGFDLVKELVSGGFVRQNSIDYKEACVDAQLASSPSPGLYDREMLGLRTNMKDVFFPSTQVSDARRIAARSASCWADAVPPPFDISSSALNPEA
jgi:hypothetical protein